MRAHPQATPVVAKDVILATIDGTLLRENARDTILRILWFSYYGRSGEFNFVRGYVLRAACSRILSFYIYTDIHVDKYKYILLRRKSDRKRVSGLADKGGCKERIRRNRFSQVQERHQDVE